MRDIKFRAWIPHRKIILDVCRMTFGKFGEEVNSIVTDLDVILFEDKIRVGLVPVEKFEDVVLMQYTGLKDKNGVEIYEGDKFKDYTQGGREYIVIWENLFAGFFAEPFLGIDRRLLGRIRIPFKHDIEVIGNIYENSNLLETR